MSPHIPLNLRLKALIPGYRGRWRSKYSLMLQHIGGLVQEGLRLDEEGGVPWMEVEATGLRFYGFWSGEKEYQQLFAMGGRLPGGVEPRYFRLVKDYVTRFLYPHMRPDVYPDGIGPDNWWGFHGQHKHPLPMCRGVPESVLRKEFSPGPGQVLIDGGAFLGMGTIHMARVVGPQGLVVALEADPDCYSLLERNVVRNAVDNVIPLRRAVWKEDAAMDLEKGPAQANTLIKSLSTGGRRLSVRAAHVDGIVGELGLDRLHMISLTINGAELEGLEGASTTLEEFRPRLRLAGWYQRDGEPLWKRAAAILNDKKYAVAVSPGGDVLAIPAERSGEI